MWYVLLTTLSQPTDNYSMFCFMLFIEFRISHSSKPTTEHPGLALMVIGA